MMEDMTYEQVINVAKKVLGEGNKRRLAVGYVPDKVKMDTFPEEFVEFKPEDASKFTGKAHFKCAVSLPSLLKKGSVKKGASDDASVSKGGDLQASKGPQATQAKVSEEIQLPEKEPEKVAPVEEEEELPSPEKVAQESVEAQGALMAALEESSSHVDEDKPKVTYYPD